MRLDFVEKYHSIEGVVTTEELPNFVVISGPNGSGKSHLLEAVSTGATRIDGQEPGSGAAAVRLFGLTQLLAADQGVQTYGNFKDRWVQLQQQVEQLRTQGSGRGFALAPDSDELETHVRNGLVVQNKSLSDAALQRMLVDSGKRLIDFDQTDYKRFTPLVIGVRDPFSVTVSEIFLTYHQHWTDNQFQRFLFADGNASADGMSDEEFERRFGPKPWNLVAESLALVGLPYELNAPEGHADSLTYEVRPRHLETGVAVPVGQLSSGEKTLMAVAMSLYTGSRLGEVIEMPRTLLLDEVDATLHPSMAQSLLTVAEEIFCDRYNVRVLLATHSPSTVALAPTESLYVMRSVGTPRLQKATRDTALRHLTVGIPTLSVSLENRRQVFTESSYDAECYQDLFTLHERGIGSPFSLVFIPSGSEKSGSSSEVKAVVTALRNSGVQSVRGVIDRDNKASAPAGVEFVAERHSVENLVLDPLPIGLMLLRDRIATPAEMALAPDARHYNVDAASAQSVVDFVCGKIAAASDDATPTAVAYVGGLKVYVPKFWLDTQGHELEDRITNAFPPLKAYKKQLKRKVIELVLSDVPQYTPSAIMDLFVTLTS